jgi:glycosyltransferase involved in cell wall biosynthesis
MAGPGIRYHALATVLARHMRVCLAMPEGSALPEDSAAFESVLFEMGEWQTIERAVQAASVILMPGDMLWHFPQLASSAAWLVIDGYDPLMPEWLATYADAPDADAAWTSRMTQLQPQYLAGDFYICASERQRDWWLGLLEANGRITPAMSQRDPSMRRLVDVVPFGLRSAPPQKTKPAIKGVWPNIAPTDAMILWGGGLWRWLDPVSAVKAMALIHAQQPSAKLVFPGTRHPNPALSHLPSNVEAARQAASEAGLLDTAVFFGDWVAYEDWTSVLLESDVALSLHFDTLETRLAFRSRVFDYIWAGLPIVSTAGDATSELVAAHGLGSVVGVQDVEGIAREVLRWLGTRREDTAALFSRAQQQFTWEQAALPLIAFCERAAGSSPDRAGRGNPAHLIALAGLRAERESLQKTVRAYEQGRFMRFMRWLKGG